MAQDAEAGARQVRVPPNWPNHGRMGANACLHSHEKRGILAPPSGRSSHARWHRRGGVMETDVLPREMRCKMNAAGGGILWPGRNVESWRMS